MENVEEEDEEEYAQKKSAMRATPRRLTIHLGKIGTEASTK